MKRAVLFDIDGTLLDSWDFIYDAVKHALTAHRHQAPIDGEIKKAMGMALVSFYQTLMPGTDPRVLAKIHQQFQEINFHKLKPFPKAKKTLKGLKSAGFLIGAVSNRTRESLLRSLRMNKMVGYFDVIVSADDVLNLKPHEEHVLITLKKLKVEPVNSYLVGDMEQDMVAGKKAKVQTVGVTYGFLGKDIAKYKPDYLITEIEDLLNIIR